MSKLYLLMSIILVTLFLLVSCIPSLQYPDVNTHQAIDIVTPDIKATSNNIDPWSTEQISDGVLSLHIESAKNNCYHRNEIIVLRLAFQNLTAKPLTLQARFFVATDWSLFGDLYVEFYTDGNDRVRIPANGYFEPILPPDNYREIPKYSPIETIISVKFPEGILSYNGIDDIVVTPSLGQYLVMLTYENTDSGSASAWTGRITSNKLSICIK